MSRTRIAMWVVSWAAWGLLLGELPACQRVETPPESTPTPVAATPVPRTWIRVRLFERLTPRTLVVRGELVVRSNGLEERQAPRVRLSATDSLVQVDGQAFYDVVTLEPLGGDLWIDPGGHYERRVRGILEIRADEDVLVVVARVGLEDYVAGVIAAELTHGSTEALRAQAVIARTFALRERGRHGWYDACDLTHCQVFKGEAGEPYQAAAQDTAGWILSADGCRPAHVYYSSTCGGHTASFRTIWPSRSAPRYLVGVPDLTLSGVPWCRASPHMHWTFRIRAIMLASILEDTYGVAPEEPLRLTLVHGTGGWVARVKVAGIPDYITGEAFHRLMARQFGWGQFKSAWFRLTRSGTGDDGDTLVFEGRGLGHGVGLCQYGADAMSRAGLGWRAILEHYFPRLRVMSWPGTCADQGSPPPGQTSAGGE